MSKKRAAPIWCLSRARKALFIIIILLLLLLSKKVFTTIYGYSSHRRVVNLSEWQTWDHSLGQIVMRPLLLFASFCPGPGDHDHHQQQQNLRNNLTSQLSHQPKRPPRLQNPTKRGGHNEGGLGHSARTKSPWNTWENPTTSTLIEFLMVAPHRRWRVDEGRMGSCWSCWGRGLGIKWKSWWLVKKISTSKPAVIMKPLAHSRTPATDQEWGNILIGTFVTCWTIRRMDVWVLSQF